MRVVYLLPLVIGLAGPALAQDDDCAAKLTAAIANNDPAAIAVLVDNATTLELVQIVRDQLEEAVGGMTLTRNQLDRLAVLDAFKDPQDTEQTDTITNILMVLKGRYTAYEKSATEAQELLEAVVKAACGDETEVTVDGPVVLELVKVELPPSDGTWAVKDGEIIYTNGGATATYSWAQPPETITAEGFTIKLAIDAESPAGFRVYAGVQAVGPFLLEPNPAEAYVDVDGTALGNNVTVAVKPRETLNSGSTYDLKIGAAFGPVVIYAYQRPVSPPS